MAYDVEMTRFFVFCDSSQRLRCERFIRLPAPPTAGMHIILGKEGSPLMEVTIGSVWWSEETSEYTASVGDCLDDEYSFDHKKSLIDQYKKFGWAVFEEGSDEDSTASK